MYPITRASLNLTRACNLACSYCFTNGCTSRDMNKEIAQHAVNFLFGNASRVMDKNRNVELSFWGGEPLLKWELLQQVVQYAIKKSQETGIPVQFGGTTNGTLLTQEKFDFLAMHKIYFMVSLDGTEETHNKYRIFSNGSGSHKVIINNLEMVLKRWPFYRVRMAPCADRIDHFFEDVKFIFDLGCNYVMFSPVYESDFTEEHWKIWEDQCYKVVDLMVELKAKGRKVEIEHFKSYQGVDNSRWPCGAGRFYVGIDIDGAIYPCHRFNKFNDSRPWQDKEVCIGHVNCGITRPEFRQSFIDFMPDCGECSRIQDTPCHGGCYAVNYDFNGSVNKPYGGLCKYVQMQKKVSEYYKSKTSSNVPYVMTNQDRKALQVIIKDIDHRLKRLEEAVTHV